MADPFQKEKIAPAPPPGAPPKKDRSKEFIAHAIPGDAEAAKERLKVARAKRKKKRTTKQLTFALPSEYVDALELLCERYDSPRAQVMKRFIEDGFRLYADAEELSVADIPRVRPPRPFDAIQAPASVESPRYDHWTPPASNGEAHYEHEAGAPPKPPPGTIPFVGATAPENAETYQ